MELIKAIGQGPGLACAARRCTIPELHAWRRGTRTRTCDRDIPDRRFRAIAALDGLDGLVIGPRESAGWSAVVCAHELLAPTSNSILEALPAPAQVVPRPSSGGALLVPAPEFV
jgi:hypothetical protein